VASQDGAPARFDESETGYWTPWYIAERRCNDLRAKLEQAEARVAELSELASEAHDLFEGILDGSYEPDSFTSQPYKFALLEDSSRSWLLRKNAEAVEVAADKYGSIGDSPFRKELFLTLKDYAQRLRQQADEAERAGGEK
jgi:hypothetical protein